MTHILVFSAAFLVGRVFGPRVLGVLGRRRRPNLSRYRLPARWRPQ